MYKTSQDLLPSIMHNAFNFKKRSHYNLRQGFQFPRPLVKSVFHRTEIIPYRGPKIWDMNFPGRLCKVLTDNTELFTKYFETNLQKQIE